MYSELRCIFVFLPSKEEEQEKKMTKDSFSKLSLDLHWSHNLYRNT